MTTFSIRRFLPEKDPAPVWQAYRIETKQGMTVLEGLHRIREDIDPTLAWRSSCRMGVCGSCAMVINGQPALACSTQVGDVSRKRIKLEPLWNFQIIKDLVTDLRPMFDQHQRLKPYIVRPDAAALTGTPAELKQTPRELLEYLQFSYCIKCGACVAACPTVAIDQTFPGPMPLTAAHRYNSDSRDGGFAARREALAEGHGVSHCHYAGECSRVCPKGVDPARAIQLMKRDLIMDLLRSRRRTPARVVAPAGSVQERVDHGVQAPQFTVRRQPSQDQIEGEE